jgi:hypothetical protein
LLWLPVATSPHHRSVVSVSPLPRLRRRRTGAASVDGGTASTGVPNRQDAACGRTADPRVVVALALRLHLWPCTQRCRPTPPSGPCWDPRDDQSASERRPMRVSGSPASDEFSFSVELPERRTDFGCVSRAVIQALEAPASVGRSTAAASGVSSQVHRGEGPLRYCGIGRFGTEPAYLCRRHLAGLDENAWRRLIRGHSCSRGRHQFAPSKGDSTHT